LHSLKLINKPDYNDAYSLNVEVVNFFASCKGFGV